jgi:3-hydroxybutyryl-CoA dehydratase
VSALRVGASASRTRVVTPELVRAFADVSDDHNPIHLDPEYAAGTPFGGCIAHGMLLGSMISAILANELPGPGTIYKRQELVFRAPVPVGARVTATVTCTEMVPERSDATFETTVVREDGTLVMSGTARVRYPAATGAD